MKHGHVLCEVVLAAIIALLASTDTVRAHESTDPTQTTATEADDAPVRTENGDATLPESRAQDQSPTPETLDGDPASRSLRFADRNQILFRLGLGGNFKDSVLGDSKAKATYGATLRWERPVHEYVATGLGFSFFAAQPQGEFREPAFDIALLIKGRYPFEMGKKERKFEAEVYVLTQVGLTIWIDSRSFTLNLIGPGWNFGVAVGYQFFINDRIGLLTEVGWIRTEAFISRGGINILLNQAAVRVGMVFPI